MSMNMPATELPITETLAPDSTDQVAQVLKDAHASETAVYPIGGGTSGSWGLPARREGIGLELQGLNEVLDYPARDMTITVGGGITMANLQATLAPESQRLPIDSPHATSATLAGVIASNHSGPLRFGMGTMRDYVIGIRAIDGRGTEFAAGGRVVKNVAGYDFCKLLTGSMGTLGVITEVTLKLKPDPPARTLLVGTPNDLEHLESLLAQLMTSRTAPTIVEYLAGQAPSQELPASEQGWLVVGFEGTGAEVEWMTSALTDEWSQHGVEPVALTADAADVLHEQLVAFPADHQAALVLQATGLPSGTSRLVQACQQIDTGVSIQAHAGNGVVIAKFAEHPDCGVATAVNRIRTVAASLQGYATVLSNPSGDEMTHQVAWGAAEARYDLMSQVKRAFDPSHILNPGRFVYQ